MTSQKFQLNITNMPTQVSAKYFVIKVLFSKNYLVGSGTATYITPLYAGSSVPTISSSNVITQLFTLIYMLNSSVTLTSTNILTSVIYV